MKKVLLIGLGNRGIKYLKYFLNNNYEVIGICKTIKTKEKIQSEFGIKVELDLKNYIDNYNFDIIVSALPINVQGEVVLGILKNGFKNRLIIESPVSFDDKKLNKIKEFNNVLIFLEEYFSLLGQFFRKVDVININNIIIEIFISKDRFEKLKSKKNSLIHIHNHFLESGIKLKDVSYVINFHLLDNVYYKINFIYNNIKFCYSFGEKIIFSIGNKKYNDNLNFDKILNLILNSNDNYSKNFYLYDELTNNVKYK